MKHHFRAPGVVVPFRWIVLFVPLGFICGCGSESSDAPKTADINQEAAAPLEIPPLDTLPIAKQQDADSPVATAGMAAGDIVELTPLKIRFCWCPPGTFTMGSREDDPDRLNNEVLTEVTFTSGFWMQQTEVTQAQYEAVMGVNPSHFKGPDLPVESVSWDDAELFCTRLSSLSSEKKAGNVFRLPTEAEWEYACRAGTATVFSFGDDPELMDSFAWYHKNAEMKTHPVATKSANPWNLHDMHGNVAEWCFDRYAAYPAGPLTDPQGAVEGEDRIFRGGGWYKVPMYQRSAYRDAAVSTSPYNVRGFRLAISPVQQ